MVRAMKRFPFINHIRVTLSKLPEIEEFLKALEEMISS